MCLEEQKVNFKKLSEERSAQLLAMKTDLNFIAFYTACESFLKDVLIKCLPVGTKIFLFGSRAAGSAGRFSDIDIGFVSPVQVSPFLLSEIREIIEDSFVPFKVDLTDFSKVGEAFKREALKTIVEWT